MVLLTPLRMYLLVSLVPGLIEGHGHLQMAGNSISDIENNLN